MITVGTAECFTHGQIGLTIHKASAGYPNIEYKFPEKIREVRVLTSMFIPSIYAAEKLLDISLPEPDFEYKYAKAYSEEKDLLVAKLMAKSLKEKLNLDIAIGTTAGVGRGAIAIITNKKEEVFTTDIYANLLTFENVLERQKRGIELGIKKFIEILKDW
ncbi:UPF0254 family protein [Methanocaldococcus infernus]